MDRSNLGAAWLLMQLRMTETCEVNSECSPIAILGKPTTTISGSTRGDCFLPSLTERGLVSPTSVFSASDDSPRPRCRTVSVCSLDMERMRQVSQSFSKDQVISLPKFDMEIPLTFVDPLAASPVTKLHGNDFIECSLKPSTSVAKYVGDKISGPVKAVLKKKFSWKSYPALERYLVQNRSQYLQNSAALNYTAEQKRYNNKLTQNLIELANQEGFVFEAFTFSMVRDRVRCYYKSFVQSERKKKRKRRR